MNGSVTGQTVALARNMCKHLNGIHLTGYSSGAEPAEVDIFIVSHKYWQGEVRSGERGLTALDKRLS